MKEVSHRLTHFPFKTKGKEGNKLRNSCILLNTFETIMTNEKSMSGHAVSNKSNTDEMIVKQRHIGQCTFILVYKMIYYMDFMLFRLALSKILNHISSHNVLKFI